jgi:PTH1 family peptidyl-tRNA hydrolase
MYIFALGNPGKKYENTPHNAGQIVLNDLAPAGAQIIYPDTFMNESGKFIKKFLDYKNISSNEYSKIVIVYDDIDLPIGEFKLAFGRGDGGHNGLISVINELGTKDFIRLRIGICPTDNNGIARKPKNIFGQNATHKYVLRNLSPNEISKLTANRAKIKNILESLYINGYEKTASFMGVL